MNPGLHWFLGKFQMICCHLRNKDTFQQPDRRHALHGPTVGYHIQCCRQIEVQLDYDQQLVIGKNTVVISCSKNNKNKQTISVSKNNSKVCFQLFSSIEKAIPKSSISGVTAISLTHLVFPPWGFLSGHHIKCIPFPTHSGPLCSSLDFDFPVLSCPQ